MPFFYNPNVINLNNSFFAAANTRHGFVSYFDKCFSSYEKIIIKGGPGTGKSTLMRNFANEAILRGYTVKYFYCSSDTSSLDAVLINEKNTVLLDGTSPHTEEPRYIGALDDVINLSDFFDKEILRKRKDEITEIDSKIKEGYKKAYSLLLASYGIYSAYRGMIFPYIDTKKLKKCTDKLAHGEKGVSCHVQKEAFGCAGPAVIRATDENFEHRYGFSDRYGISSIFMEALKSSLDEKRIAHSYSLCPISLIPSSISIQDSVLFEEPENGASCRIINTSRFISPEIKSEKRKLDAL